MRYLCVFGTRPEAIKMAPVIKALRQAGESAKGQVDVRVCVTAQHREMLDHVLELFEVEPDADLNLMRAGQDLTDITVGVLQGMRTLLPKLRPDRVLVHGDTTTTFAASLAAFYEKIPVAHVEAGLRTGNMYSPWPEEMNRKLTAAISDMHFAPTARARDNLLAEGVPASKVFVTGNTVIDALLQVSRRLEADAPLQRSLDARFPFLRSDRRLILVTGHRRENFGEPFERLCRALRALAGRPDVQIVYPVHLNPNVREPVFRILGAAASGGENWAAGDGLGAAASTTMLDTVAGAVGDAAGVSSGRTQDIGTAGPSLVLIDPVDYLEFVYLMQRSYFIITDSGGVQEEAPSLGKPVLVTRETTERPEAVEAGTVRLVGTDEAAIVREAARLLDDPQWYRRMSQAVNPYGDGRAAERIVSYLLRKDGVVASGIKDVPEFEPGNLNE